MGFRLFSVLLLTSDLFRELLLTQFVECIELSAENPVVPETSTGQFDSDDYGTVWNHHGHRAELDLEVLRQLLSTSVARVLEGSEVSNKTLFTLKTLLLQLFFSSIKIGLTYHCEKNAKFRVHVHHVSICKDKLLLLVLFALQDNVYLLRCHRQHWQLDAVELIKAAPGTRLCQTCR